MAKFIFHFEGESDNPLDPNGYGCKMIIQGELDTIGKLLADYVKHELTAGHPEPARIIFVCLELLQNNPGVNGRIRPIDKYKL